MKVRLPDPFLEKPIAHRALHGVNGAAENSLLAAKHAIRHGYGIEVDIQLSSDGDAMVFHDDTLERVTLQKGKILEKTADELAHIPLIGQTGDSACETIPTLSALLEVVSSQVPILIELKDQSGILGMTDGALERATLQALDGYLGPIALMSFNPHSIVWLSKLAPELPRGLITDAFDTQDWAKVPDKNLKVARNMELYHKSNASFVSHNVDDLASSYLDLVRQAGDPVLTWTIKTPESEAKARRLAHNITFEHYLPEIP